MRRREKEGREGGRGIYHKLLFKESQGEQELSSRKGGIEIVFERIFLISK